jgi:spore germination protein KC
MRKVVFFIIFSSLLLLLTGCWGSKRLEGEVYITALGFDYQDEKFVVYYQGLNFGSIARQEGAAKEELPILIGRVKEESLHMAYGLLEEISAMPLNLGQVQTIILSDNIIKEKMDEVVDVIGQSPLLRYNMYLFGTKGDMEELLKSQSFFNFSQLYSILHRPDEIIKQNYTLPILQYNQFISRYYLPVGTILIPSLTVDSTHFKEDKPKDIAYINGEFLISQKQYKGWMSKKDIRGIRWFAKDEKDITIRLGTKKIAVKMYKPKSKIIVITGDQPSYEILIKGEASLLQNLNNSDNRSIEKEINKVIKNEIVSTIKAGDILKNDVLNLSEKAYKFHRNQWDIEAIRRFDVNSVKEVKINIKIMEYGNYK